MAFFDFKYLLIIIFFKINFIFLQLFIFYQIEYQKYTYQNNSKEGHIMIIERANNEWITVNNVLFNWNNRFKENAIETNIIFGVTLKTAKEVH